MNIDWIKLIEAMGVSLILVLALILFGTALALLTQIVGSAWAIMLILFAILTFFVYALL